MEKLLSPYQNFLYVIQGYDLLPAPLEELTARVMPWVELIAGVFVVLGLWTKWSLRVVLLLIMSFITIVGQAILRKLPLDECGCFGQLISFPLPVVILLDSCLGAMTGIMLLNIPRTAAFGLDQYFSKTEDPR